MNKFLDQEEEMIFSEPILAQDGVRLGINFVSKETWQVKDKDKWSDVQRQIMQEYVGREFTACKLTMTISDDSVRTEHENAKPRLTIEQQFNIEKYPYPDKDGKVQWLGRQNLYQLEEAFGFEPKFKANGEFVEAHITKNGNKVAPKVEGAVVTRVLNPDFFGAYFQEDGTPIADNWIGKVIYANVGLEKSEQFGDKNVIKRFVKAPEV